MLRKILLTLCLSTYLGGAALAGQATPEQAASITEGFQTYLGHAPGVVAVKPAGEAYVVSLDFSALYTALKSSFGEAEFEMAPLQLKLTDKGGGQWNFIIDQPLSYKLVMPAKPGKMSTTVRTKHYKISGTYDQVLGFITEDQFEGVEMVSSSVTSVPGQPDVTSQQIIAKMSGAATAKGTSAASVDHELAATLTGIEQTSQVPGKANETPMTFKMKLPELNYKLRALGLNLAAIRNVWAYSVAHPSKPGSNPEEVARVRALLQALAPIFTNANIEMRTKDVVLETQVGQFKAGGLGLVVSLNGLVKNGLFEERMNVEGFEVPDLIKALIPPYAKQMVPTSFALNFTVKDFDPAAAFETVMAELPLAEGAVAAPGMDDRMVSSLLPGGAVTITTDGTRLQGAPYDIKLSGSMVSGPHVQPNGKMTVDAKGLDQIIAALQSAPQTSELTMGIAGILLIKGLGKPAGDYLRWDLDAPAGGPYTINGIDLEKLGGPFTKGANPAPPAPQ